MSGFVFKENWFSKDEIGEYISAISNGAAFRGKILKISRVSNYRLIEYILNKYYKSIEKCNINGKK
ncbi:MAG: hypothetical protein IJP63_07260 [Acholeplasmatales bacterium]|nr:hypothetical protein [Acholeplasmatales bacterium]